MNRNKIDVNLNLSQDNNSKEKFVIEIPLFTLIDQIFASVNLNQKFYKFNNESKIKNVTRYTRLNVC